MTNAQTKFVPVRDGFRFYNHFELNFPVKMQLPLVGSIDLNKMVYGLCGGMCFTALDFYHQRASVPAYAKREEIDRRLFNYLCERQLESLQVTVLVKIFEWMLREDHDIHSRMNRSELPRLKRALEKGEPQVLCLIRTQGLGNPTNNHQVLATAYETMPDGTICITLYDPNHPGKEPVIRVLPRKPGQPNMRLEQSTGEALRAFFIVPYRQRDSIPLPPREAPVSFSLEQPEEPPFRLRWPVDSHRVNQRFGENPQLYKAFKQPGHEGLDLYAPAGGNIYACFDGEVYEAQQRGGYGLQVRIKHHSGELEFRTVYAHLQRALVSPGQQVRAGQRIGLAGSTGSALGAHLHLTLKVKGHKTPGYPDDIVDPWPYLEGSDELADGLPVSPSGVLVYTRAQLDLHRQPNASSELIGILPAGECLPALGEAAAIKTRIGRAGQWLQVQTAARRTGYVAAWLVEDAGQMAFPPSGLVVYPTGEAPLYAGPGSGFTRLGVASSRDPLDVLGDAGTARAKLGKAGEWLQVQAQDGTRAFTPAQLLHATGQLPAASGLVVYPNGTINVRARPSTDSHILTVVTAGDALRVLGDAAAARASLGEQDRWLYVQAPGKFTGYAAAGQVSAGQEDAPAAPPAPTLAVTPTAGIVLRVQPSRNAARVSGAAAGTRLEVIDADPAAARARIGQPEQWLYVQKPDGTRGWAEAWLLHVV